jgi:hypothetical protein
MTTRRIEYRWAENQNNRLPALAADLVRRRVEVIATENLRPVLAAQAATKSIPFVFAIGGDPVEIGPVINLKTAKTLEHDPEKWSPVFGKDHAPAKR